MKKRKAVPSENSSENTQRELAEVGEVAREIQEWLRPNIEALAVQLAERMVSPNRLASSGKSFKTLAEAWFETEAKRYVEPANERRHINHMRSIWERTESELTPRVAREMLHSLLKPRGTLGPNTVNKVHSTARRIIREAQINGDWGPSNPFVLVPRLKETKTEYERVTIAEARAFLPQLRPDRRRMALTMLFLGTRPGELIALRKADVDVVRRELIIRRSRSRNRTKTGTERRVPVPDELLAALVEAMRESPSEFVFCAADGGKLRDDTKLSRTLQDAFRKAGLVLGWEYICNRKGCGFRETLIQREPRWCGTCGRKLLTIGVPRAVRFYDLRHSAATLHREAGCDPLVIQLVLGHSTRNTTDKVYTHLSADYIRLELNRLSLYRDLK